MHYPLSGSHTWLCRQAMTAGTTRLSATAFYHLQGMMGTGWFIEDRVSVGCLSLAPKQAQFPPPVYRTLHTIHDYVVAIQEVGSGSSTPKRALLIVGQWPTERLPLINESRVCTVSWLRKRRSLQGRPSELHSKWFEVAPMCSPK